jgi:hypothetical protein
MALGVDLASKRNEYQVYILWSNASRCVGLTTLPLTFQLFGNSGSLNVLEPKGLSKPVMGLIYLYLSLLLKFESPAVHCCEMCCSP